MPEITSQLSTALADRYRIGRQLGEGGMATVYLAEDLKHDRKVAVKVLRPELAAILGGERFLNEIKVTANLQHPNILPLYDSGQAVAPPLRGAERGPGGEVFLYYIMPYIEGESLRDKLDREKQLSIDEAVDIATSVAGALSFAHDRGVIHRDIKPANILFQAGQPIVADFGIALAVSHAGGPRLTETGLSLGSPQYMSPEQATGDRTIDARSDVYSLGAMTYEMLTGDPPHTGSTVQAIIARIVSESPISIRQIRETVPNNVDAAVLRALAKMPADRFHGPEQFAEALADPAFTFPTATTPSTHAPTGGRSTRFAVALAMVMTVLALWGWLRPQSSPAPSGMVTRTVITLPEGQRLGFRGGRAYPLDISRDGTRVVYVSEQGGVMRLMMRDMSDFTVQPLAGTEGARQPFFSPDGGWVGFFAGNELRRVSISGGGPIAIAQLPPGLTGGASWGTDSTILFGVEALLYRVPVSGGDPTALEITLATDGNEGRADSTGNPQWTLNGFEGSADSTSNPAGDPRWPHHLPDGTHALVMIAGGTGVLDLGTLEMRYLFSGVQARYLKTGHLIFNAGQERISTVPFDLDRFEITGPEAPAVEGVFRGPGGGAANFVISQTGTLVYVTGGFERSLWFVDRNGRETPIAIEPRGYRFPSVSPDGNHIAVIVDPRPSDVWIVDLQRLSAGPITTEGHHVSPAWAPDGERLAFGYGGDQFWMRWREGGEPQRVANRPYAQYQPSWSPDDRIMVDETAPETGRDLITLNVVDGTSTPFLVTEADEWSAAFSPDGRWVAYRSDVSGADEVYIRPFPGPGPRHTVSVGGGADPRWSTDGTELFYRSGNRIMAVAVRTTPTISLAIPQELFSGSYDFTQTKNWDVTPDGRFVMVKGDPSSLRQLQVVQNFFEELKTRRSR